jgi:hypothetical protein
MGTSTELKHKYGKGYEMTLMCRPDIEAKVVELIEEVRAPSTTRVGGSY